MPTLRICISLLLLAATLGQAPPAATTAPADETAAALEETFSSVPESPEQIAALGKRLDAELAALAPTTRPTTSQPTTQPDAEPAEQVDAWRQELWKALTEWRARLRDCESRQRLIAVLKTDAEVTKLTTEIAELKQKTEQVTGARLPWFVTAQDVTEAQQVYDTQNQSVDALTATLKQQESQLSGGFKSQREKLRPELERIRAIREQLDSTLDADLKAADSDMRREIIRLRRRVAAARLAALETTRVSIDLNEVRTQQEVERNKLKRDALKPYVVALRARMNALIEGKSRGRADALKRRLAATDVRPLERSYLELQLLREENVAKVHSHYANAIRDRFQASTLQTHLADVERDRIYWERFSASIARRSASDILDAYREAGRELRAAQAELAALQGLLDLSITEQRQLEEMQTRQLERFGELQSHFKDQLGRSNDEQANKWALEVGTLGLDIRNAYEEMQKLESEVLARLTQGVKAAESHAKQWEQARSRLYWSHLVTRGPSVVERRQYRPILAEWEMLRQGALAASAKRVWSEVVASVRQSGESEWTPGALTIMLVLLLGAWVQRWCLRVRREADAIEAQDPTVTLPFRVRLRNQVGSVATGVVPALIPIVAVWLLLWASGLRGSARTVADVSLGALALLAVLEGMLRILLHQSKARYRVVPCSSTVARHYRRSIRVVALLGVVSLWPAMLLDAVDLAPGLQGLLTQWFQLTTLFVVLLFLLRKSTVLNIFPREDRSRFVKTVAVLRTVHPLLVLLTIGLIIAHFSGFRAFAEYVSLGLIATLGAMLLAFFAYQVLGDFLLWLSRDPRLAPTHVAAVTPADSAASPTLPAVHAPAQDAHAGLHLALTVTRWLLTLGVLLVSGAVWGIRPYEIKSLMDLELWHKDGAPVTLWRVGGAVLALVATILVSRTTRQTLNARVFPRYPGIDRGARAAISTLLHYVLLIIGVYISLETLRLDFGALAVLFGGLGLGVGLGLQPLVVNFVSGLMILFERHVKVGDVVMVGDKTGEVTQISMRSTTLRTADGLHLVIPNGDFINQRVENWTLYPRPIRGVMTVSAAYGSDPRAVHDLLLSIARAETRVLREPAPEVYFTDLADSSLNFGMACWFYSPADRWYGQLAMRYAIVEKFREAGIEIPFPQREFSFAPGEVLNVHVSHDTGRAAPPNTPSS